ncbi:hypothetical protein [Amycolatopsis australiensis]|nr:hypothetical protein [Amycolatopsis australiensis]
MAAANGVAGLIRKFAAVRVPAVGGDVERRIRRRLDARISTFIG